MQKWYRWIGVYAIWRSALLLLSVFGARVFPYQSTFGITTTRYAEDIPVWWGKFANFDGVIFLLLASQGYRAEELPFFPLFPMVVRATQAVLQTSPALAAFTINTVLFGGAIYFAHKLLAMEQWRWRQQRWFFVVVLLFPTALFYTAAYNDSLFFFLACATLFFGRRKLWIPAAATASLAALTRLNGQALFAFLLTEYVFQNASLKSSWDIFRWPRQVWQAIATKKVVTSGILISIAVPLSFGAYLFWIEQRFGDWHLFFDGVKVWHRNELTFPLQTLWRYVKILLLHPRITLVYWVAWGEALATLLYGTLLWRGWRRLRPSYWIFFAVSVLIPMATGTLQGMPRYGLHLFPMFFLLTQWLVTQRRWVRVVYVLVSATFLAVYTMLFTQGYFVA